ncbi:MAG: hypothetical protein ACLTW9_02835 [Enterocloster sp.]
MAAGVRPISRILTFFLECGGIVTAINQDVDHQAYRTTNVEMEKNGKLAIGRFYIRNRRGRRVRRRRCESMGRQRGYPGHCGRQEGRYARLISTLAARAELNMGEWFEIPEIVDIEVK